MGVMAKEELCENVAEARRASERVMTVVAVLVDNVLRLIYGYALRSGRSFEEKSSFFMS